MRTRPKITSIEIIQYELIMQDVAPEPTIGIPVYKPGSVLKRRRHAIRIHSDMGLTGAYSGGSPMDYAAIAGFASCLLGRNPLQREDILAHRAVAVADSSRNLPPRTTGLLSGQDTLTVPDLAAKLQAQVMGLGVGYLPQCIAAPTVAQGRLVIKTIEEPKVSQMLYLAWRTAHRGKALRWFVGQVYVPGWLDRALAAGTPA